MKKFKRLALYALATGIFVTSFTIGNDVVHANEGERAIYDGKVQNGRTFGPIRAIGDELGAQVDWNNKAKLATIIKDDKVIKLKHGSKMLIVNDNEIKMDVSLLLEKGKVYLPLRYISEAFGNNIGWDKEKQLAYLEDRVPYLIIYAQPIDYRKGYELLGDAVNHASNLSGVTQKRAHLKPYFTDTMSNKIIQNNGLGFEVNPAAEHPYINESYSYPDRKTMKIRKVFFGYESKRGYGDIIHQFTLVEKNGKWVVNAIEEEWAPFRP
ncbi:copper amine oxidase N-terminal domain-containing protein [Solibacillus sp. FSL K6-1523]|uniref:copper amine oxidase N-terminal domain-containing protein n=1 Tax=Solibacillus sp. FSL K6-1523 TaxID=2921471 RepID=UPI0030FCEBC2